MGKETLIQNVSSVNLHHSAGIRAIVINILFAIRCSDDAEGRKRSLGLHTAGTSDVQWCERTGDLLVVLSNPGYIWSSVTGGNGGTQGLRRAALDVWEQVKQGMNGAFSLTCHWSMSPNILTFLLYFRLFLFLFFSFKSKCKVCLDRPAGRGIKASTLRHLCLLALTPTTLTWR